MEILWYASVPGSVEERRDEKTTLMQKEILEKNTPDKFLDKTLIKSNSRNHHMQQDLAQQQESPHAARSGATAFVLQFTHLLFIMKDGLFLKR